MDKSFFMFLLMYIVSDQILIKELLARPLCLDNSKTFLD